MGIVVRCRQCSQEFEPEPMAIRSGAWRLCPSCRLREPAGRPICPTQSMESAADT